MEVIQGANGANFETACDAPGNYDMILRLYLLFSFVRTSS